MKSDYNEKYYTKNKEKLLDISHIYHTLNKESISLNKKEYYLKNKESILAKKKISHELNKIERNKKKKEYREKNKEKVAQQKKKSQQKFLSTVEGRLIKNTRASIRRALIPKGFTKDFKSTEILGCTPIELKMYLESKFEPWMNWKNKGLYNGTLNYGWDIDHIIPLSSTNIKSELLHLLHYTNLQPLCSKVNRDIKKASILN